MLKFLIKKLMILTKAIDIDIEKIRIIKESKKGAALVEYNDKGAWLTPDLVEALKSEDIFFDRNLQVSLKFALENAEVMDKEELEGKEPFLLIKKGTMIEERKKAILWSFEDGKDIWFPKSQIITSTHNKDEITIPIWLAEAKEEEEEWVIPKNAKKIWR